MMKLKTRKSLFLATALFIFSNGVTKSQEKKGIHFEHGLSWEQLKAKAKAEDKYIFMDVFASWCVPCKWMDENTYPSDKLTILNNKFISVKVQMDTTKNDTEEIKAWHEILSRMKSNYNIKAYPTFLFFDPKGQAVHKIVGRLDAAGFAKVAINALDQKQQFFTLLKSYRNKELSYDQMPLLVNSLARFGEMKEARSVAEDYVNNYLYKLKDDDLFTKENLVFVTTEGFEFFNSKSKIFSLIYKNPEKANQIVENDGFAQNMISWVIKKEELYNKLWKPDNKAYTAEPEWGKFRHEIKEKYNVHYADSLILPTQLLFYQIERNWKEYQRIVEIAIALFPPMKGRKRFAAAVGVDPRGPFTDASGLNQIAWIVFQGSNDKLRLKKALFWSNWSINMESADSKELGAYIDTKANLLYKLGRVSEAIELEEKAVKMKIGQPDEKLYNDALDKMKKSLPTWNSSAIN